MVADRGRVRWKLGVPKIGLPEVDRIFDGSKLAKFTFTTHSPDALKESCRKVGTLLPPSWARSSTTSMDDKVDRISRMPDEILHFIISLLTVRQAAATSILSTRWRNLWSTSLSCLNFDIPNMIGHNYPETIFLNKSENYIMEKRSNFTRWVLNTDSASDIDRWIISSVARGATDIHLDFHYTKFFGCLHYPCKEYEFPAQQVALTLKYLHLTYCQLHLPPDFTGFTSLISLSLSSVVVSRLLIDNILSKCPLLEFLSLEHCRYPKDTRFKFAGPSLRLKHLHIGSIDPIKSIELHNINLLSFETMDLVSKVSIKDTPLLARLELSTINPVEINNTPRLETLFLLQKYEKTSSVSQTYVFNNLKRLVFIAHGYVVTNLVGVVYVLEACCLLEKLEIDMGIIGVTRQYIRPAETLEKLTALPGFPLKKLEEIEIYGLEDYPEKIELVKYLLNNAVVLQKMEIYTTSKQYLGNGRWILVEDTMWQAIRLEEIRNKLQDLARYSTKVELFSSLNL